jgi:signal transduction histidine kinase
LLDDLLDVSRFTRGELTLKKAYVPLLQVLDAAVEAVQPLINAKQHRLQLEVDPVRLTQVVSNLLTNAAKYTDPGGEITLGCRLEADSLVIFVALVKALVELHGGHMEVRSAGREQGTTFTVILPRSGIAADADRMISSDRDAREGPSRCV